MTDYFALLHQPRQPWLDPEQLKEAFHSASRRAHPDAANTAEGAFAEINQAYQTLRDPKRRLQHLLELRGQFTSKQSASIPAEAEALFPEVAEVCRAAELIHERTTATQSALSRSLLQKERSAIAERLRTVNDHVSLAHENALLRLQNARLDDVTELQALYLLFSYLGRWLDELQEKQLLFI